MLLTFILLGLSICSVWAPNIPFASIPLWVPLYIGAIISGLSTGYLTWPAVPSLAMLSAIAWASQHQSNTVLRTILVTIAAILALIMALHYLPGFANPIIVDGVRITSRAAPYTLYANFDKGAAGLILLVFFSRRVRTFDDLRVIIKPTLAATVATVVVVLGVALVVGYVRPEPKFPYFTLAFLAINLLFVCVAEEAMFRGLIQERLIVAVTDRRYLVWLPVVVSTVLFAVAHASGGPRVLLFAGMAGLGYSIIYNYTRKIESAIFVHFVVNAVHFFGFTYPFILR